MFLFNYLVFSCLMFLFDAKQKLNELKFEMKFVELFFNLCRK